MPRDLHDPRTASFRHPRPAELDRRSGFRSLMGRLPFPIAGRAEVRKVSRRGAGGPGVELTALDGAPVRSVAAGRVAFADTYADYGLTVIVDHVRGGVVWACPGKNAETLNAFFEELGKERCAQLEAVTLDMSGAYLKAVTEASPQARVIFDRFHVQRLAHDALDEVRREMVREAEPEDRGALKKTRFVLHKNPWNLSTLEAAKVAEVQKANQPLYRAYMLKETLAAILDGRQVNVARKKLLEWIGWAARSRLAPFRKLARTVRGHLEGILAYVATGLSNGRTEGLNGKIRTITRRSYGFHSAQSLIALIFLCCSGITLQPVHR